MNIVTVLGARPQFIKAAVLSRTICATDGIEEKIIHTGQHFDDSMSKVFFDELGMPEPSVMLKCDSGSHGQMTGKMIMEIEAELLQEKPDLVVVYGDTNSTLAATIAAVKIGVDVAHVEAGARSFNNAMPEEINRVLSDRVSKYLFCSTQTAVENLNAEGISDGVSMVGDIMYESFLYYQNKMQGGRSAGNQMCLFTCHRPSNTDTFESLEKVVGILELLSQKMKVVFPLHPRVKAALERFNFMERLSRCDIDLIGPVSYFEIVRLLTQCSLVVTDSGGLQKEALFASKYCITLREDTEWVETITSGANYLVGCDKTKFAKSFSEIEELDYKLSIEPSNFYGDGDTSSKIISTLMNQ